MTIDWDAVHATVQLPMTLLLFLLGGLLLDRARATASGEIKEPSFGIKIALAGVCFAIGLKQAYWQVHATLRAMDMHRSAALFYDAIYIPAALSAIALICGAGVVSIAVQPYLGSRSVMVTVVGLTATLVAAAIIAGGAR